ncbi:MAG: response regulator [Deltaproteobacteria bacterium]|jgi:two-component system response regulator BaeR|nr:response regulator [Deltaproteobacteria bacterium]
MCRKILIVEDEPRLASILSDYIAQAGMSPYVIDNGLEVVEWVKREAPGLILLDLMLPGKDGMEICKEVRHFSELPIIMVTARIEEIDRLLGLEIGADDYICKPFSPREVIARVKAVLRRTAGHEVIANAELVLDESRYLATLHGQKLDLTAVEYQLLSALAKSPGRIYSRDQLMEKIYPDQRIVEDRTIDSHIKKLRKKMASISEAGNLIHSVYGVGYKFEQLDG